MSSLNGTHINYFFICRRKLWLFSHSLQMERENENVKIGKLISETTFERKKHELDLTDELEKIGIRIDFYDKKNKIIHEIKKSDSFEEAHKWQVLFYIHFLKEKGIEGVTGEIDYPKLRKTEKIILSDELESELKGVLHDIKNILEKDIPPSVEEAKVKLNICKKCSYYEMCYS